MAVHEHPHRSSGLRPLAGDTWAGRLFMLGLLGIGLAAVCAGDTLGVGKVWARLPLVRRSPWLR